MTRHTTEAEVRSTNCPVIATTSSCMRFLFLSEPSVLQQKAAQKLSEVSASFWRHLLHPCYSKDTQYSSWSGMIIPEARSNSAGESKQMNKPGEWSAGQDNQERGWSGMMRGSNIGLERCAAPAGYRLMGGSHSNMEARCQVEVVCTDQHSARASVINSLQLLSPPKEFFSDAQWMSTPESTAKRKNSGTVLLVAGLGQEHRLGRWLNLKDGVVNGALVVALSPRTLS
ncbi:hypothetical protein B0H14DRAFT_3169692 [Mycena olivaceomarginata]|nr:hypothetical protein B0H14DRAFT_3169692 [Mycena olivaceomarginata]